LLVILDCQDIDIHKVNVGEKDLSFTIKSFRKYGSALHIKLTDDLQNSSPLKLSVNFTSGSGAGLCWLDPIQTAGKTMPYLYSQGQAVLNRSFFPCMDSPSVKSTWSAAIKVPKGFNVVMSASHWEPPKQLDDQLECHFNMDIKVPVYLVALAVGDIASKEIGPRSRVWTEPCLLDQAQYEFQEHTEKFISTGERLFGPYVWTRYDILVMPPSFPFGGMENPCLTFVTPTLLVGDRSLVDVIMHEISHSWFGNLVTNASWSEFFLNEGLTMYAQRRICTEILGKEFTCLEAATGKAILMQDLKQFGEGHNFTKLHVDLDPEDDPDDTYNEIPYEKGYCFVSYLRSLVRSDDEFDGFLKAYVQKYAYKSVVSSDFLSTFLEHFPHLKGIENKEGFEFDRWLNTPGTPVYFPDLSPGETLTKPAEALAKHWAKSASSPGSKPVDSEDVRKWHTYQVWSITYIHSV
jgi:aminopeptidase B